MKILVIQLARFGDIFQTWPTLAALKRSYPQAEIDILVREKYRAATKYNEVLNNVHILASKSVLAPLMFQQDGLESAKNEMNQFVNELADFKYDQIINLSFSPLSSYIVDAIRHPEARVSGYARAEDGFLSIPDDASAYFYAQVGVEKQNRLHLTDVFALVAGVNLQREDFVSNVPNQHAWAEHRIVIHVGGSQAKKVCHKEDWIHIIEKLSALYAGTIYLVGTESESLGVEALSDNVVDLCGQTNISELFGLLSGAELLLACDSMLIQIANLTQTKTLNISFPSVCFWETGPRAFDSRVLAFESIDSVDVDMLVDEVRKLIFNEETKHCYWLVDREGVLYDGVHEGDIKEFQWQLIRAIYMGEHFPVVERKLIASAFERIHELTRLGLEQIDSIEQNQSPTVCASILDQVDLLLQKVADFCPEVEPLVRWFLCEKIRIPPGNVRSVSQATRAIFDQLLQVTQLYTLTAQIETDRDERGLSWK